MRKCLVIMQRWFRADRDWRTVDAFAVCAVFDLYDLGRAVVRGCQWDWRIIVKEVPPGEVVVWRGDGAEGLRAAASEGCS